MKKRIIAFIMTFMFSGLLFYDAFGQATLPTGYDGPWNSLPAGWSTTLASHSNAYDCFSSGVLQLCGWTHRLTINFDSNPDKLTFKVISDNVPGSERVMLVQESTDGSSWKTIETIRNIDFSSAGTCESYSIWLSTPSRYVRFRMNDYSGPDCFYIDSVNISSRGTVCYDRNIPSVPYLQHEPVTSTCGFGQDYYGMACMTDPKFNGQDIVYKFTADRDYTLYAFIKAYNEEGGLAVLDTCPDVPGASCLGYDIWGGFGCSSPNPDSCFGLVVFNAYKGKTYYIVHNIGDGGASDCGGDLKSTIFELNYYYEYEPLPDTALGEACCENSGFEYGNMTGWTAIRGGTPSGSSDYSYDIYLEPNILASTPGFQPDEFSLDDDLGSCPGGPPGDPAEPSTANNIRFTTTSGKNTIVPNTDSVVYRVCPAGGDYSVRIGNQEAGHQTECLEKNFEVTWNNAFFTYLYAAVFYDPPDHDWESKPRITVTMSDSATGEVIECGNYDLPSSGATVNGYYRTSAPNCANYPHVYYKNWTAVSNDLSSYIGRTVNIKACVMDCGQSAHYGYAYFDTYCAPFAIEGATICTVTDTAYLEAPRGFGDYQWYEGPYPGTTHVGSGRTIAIPNPQTGDIYTAIYYPHNVGTNCGFKYLTDTILVLGVTTSEDTCADGAGTTQLFASSGDTNATYAWSSDPPGFTSTDQNPVVTNPASTTNYIVTASSPLGCVTVDTVKIVIPCTVPVDMTHFSGYAEKNANQLQWKTASEENNERFEIQCSEDGNTFTTIGEAAGAGNSQKALKYNYTDYNPGRGTNYYRLKQVDFNGDFNFSRTIAIASWKNDLSINVSPVDGRIRLDIQSKEESAVEVYVYNIIGKSIYQEIIHAGKGGNSLLLKPHLESGYYMVRIISDNKSYQEKIWIE